MTISAPVSCMARALRELAEQKPWRRQRCRAPQNSNGAQRDGRAHQGFHRVESRDWEHTGRASRDSPLTLVASPERAQTTVIARQHRLLPIDRVTLPLLPGLVKPVAAHKRA